MNSSNKTRLLPISSKLLATILALNLLPGCQSPEVGSQAVTTHSKSEAVQVQPLPPKPAPVDVAQAYLAQTEIQLKQTPSDPEFNAFQDLVKIGQNPKGLRHLKETLDKKGLESFYSTLTNYTSDKSSKLYQQRDLLQKALSKPVLSAKVVVPESGLLSFPDTRAFEEALDSLSVLSLIQERNPELESKVDGYLFALKVGRKASINAVDARQYELALAIQEEALKKLGALIETEAFSPQELRILISRLQMELRSEQEVLPILDIEYFASVRILANKTLSEDVKNKETNGLASLYLTIRPIFAGEKPAKKGFQLQQTVPELEGCQFAATRLDLWSTFERCQRFGSLLASVELKAALNLYRTEKGSYPNSLELLVPGFLTRIPVDSFSVDGQFDYQKTPESYRLSSKLHGKPQGLKTW